MNAGLIDEQGARKRRQAIAREAEFYGAMDGAAKFNQRDSLATILITAINIVAGLLIGVLQTFAVAMDGSMISAVKMIGMSVTPETFGYALLKLKISQVAPILPYLLLVLMLVFRPKGLLGTREG